MDEASGQLRETRRLDLRCRAAIAPNRPYPRVPPGAHRGLTRAKSSSNEFFRDVKAGVLHDHLGLAERVLAETVFPDSAPVKAMKGLVG